MFADLIQPTHLLLLLGVVLLVLGPKRLPEVGRSLGKSIHGFKEAVSGEESDLTMIGVTSERPDEPGPAGQLDPVLGIQ